MSSRVHAPLVSANGASQAPLHPQQKKFRTLIQRIDAQRALLASWQEAVPLFRERHALEMRPLLDQYVACQAEFAYLLDAQASRKGLSKADRSTLGQAIADLAGSLVGQMPAEAARQAMKALYNKHSGSDFDSEEEEGQEMARAMAQDLFGMDFATVDLDSPEELARHVHAQMDAMQRQAEQQAAEKTGAAPDKARKPSARERRAQEQAQEASQSLREIYRKLASTLHPDRESDPQERERKTALMQRANQAYESRNLLDLLQLQLEAEQIDAAQIAGLSEQRLKQYNRLLAEQLAELQREVRDTHDAFCMEFDLEPLPGHKPARAMTQLREQRQELAFDLHRLQSQITAIRDTPTELKQWLKEQRAAQREDEFSDMEDLLAMLQH